MNQDKLFKVFFPLLIIVIVLIATNPKDSDYSEYLSIRVARGDNLVAYALLTSYCQMNAKYDRHSCVIFQKQSQLTNPSYLEDWIKSQGPRLFKRTNFLLFSHYEVEYDTHLIGDNSSQAGSWSHTGILNNFL